MRHRPPVETINLDWDVRLRLTNQAWERVERDPVYRIESWLAWSVVVASLLILFDFVADPLGVRSYVTSWIGWLGSLSDFLPYVLFPGVPALALTVNYCRRTFIYKPLFREYLSQLLLENGLRPAACVQCKQPLQGLDVVYCPRCGQPWPPAESPTGVPVT
jgi:hypothetical protein